MQVSGGDYLQMRPRQARDRSGSRLGFCEPTLPRLAGLQYVRHNNILVRCTMNPPETTNSKRLGAEHKSWTIRSRGTSGPAKQDSSILKAAVRPSLSASMFAAKLCRSRTVIVGRLDITTDVKWAQSGADCATPPLFVRRGTMQGF